MEILLPTFILVTTLSSLGIAWAYEAIFSFGDSLADTGNRILSDNPPFANIGELPYGETFFHHPTGRYSDGRLVVDFLAEAFALPYLPPYLGLVHGKKYRQGVNFAVGGATALDPEFFIDRGLGHTLQTNDSLSVQIGWFKKIKSSLCTTKQDCDDYFKKGLFLVGEIGGNDYNNPFAAGLTMEEARALVPLVVDKIAEATSMLIEEGAVELVVPGNFPIGCWPWYLALFQSPYGSDYDQTNGCLKSFNAVSLYHNNQLKNVLKKLKRKYPYTRIIYADYYNAALSLINTPKTFGYTSEVLRACCGGGGQYNYNRTSKCGNPGSTTCKDPSIYVNWDGIHLTEAAYRYIAFGLIKGPYASPSILSPTHPLYPTIDI